MNKSQPFDRIVKVNSLLLHELDTLLQREKIEQKGFREDIILSITKVEASRDLRHAKVYWTVMSEKFRGEAKKFLESKAYTWQNKLGEKIVLKCIPKLQFFYDKGQENAMAVEKILSKLNK